MQRVLEVYDGESRRCTTERLEECLHTPKLRVTQLQSSHVSDQRKLPARGCAGSGLFQS